MPNSVNIVGGGLAGSELAYQLASRGVKVRLFEMRPQHMTPAHKTGNLAELVCSNTFKSLAPHSAPGIFKNELIALGSLLIQSAPKAQVPAGEALAVDREVFSKTIEDALLSTGNVERISAKIESLDDLPDAFATVIATGPLTQGRLAEMIQGLADGHGLYFYDAIAPVIDASTIDKSIAFGASRYGKGGDDYLNCPMSREEYDAFYEALIAAEKVPYHDFEEAKHFQGCQPIEAIAETGKDSPRFGPMKPVGLTDPRTGRRPHAVVQLRIDDLSRSAYNMVGFQTKLKYDAQKTVFKLIPGLQNAEFLRMGSMHRNTYISTPTMLNQNFGLKNNPKIRFAGQITGVEGYTESSAIGLLLSMALMSEMEGREFELPPRHSALGSLCHYLFHCDPKEFQPVNVHFGLFDTAEFESIFNRRDKRAFRASVGEVFIQNVKNWRDKMSWTPANLC